MSEWKWISDKPVNLPSTYQQVVRNMFYIQENILPAIEKLNSTILNPDPDAKNTDAHLTEDGFEVTHMTVDVSKQDVNDPPSAYVRNVTLELKLADAIGLPATEGVGTYATVVTINVPEGHPKVWQLAYGESGPSSLYYREALESADPDDPVDGWGGWYNAAPTKQIVEAADMPYVGTQDVGDFWLQPIETDGFELVDTNNPADILNLSKDSAAHYGFEDTMSGESENIDWDEYEYQDPSGGSSMSVAGVGSKPASTKADPESPQLTTNLRTYRNRSSAIGSDDPDSGTDLVIDRPDSNGLST